MAEPSRQELQKMQRDAEQRMRDMQRRTARFTGNGDIPPVPNFVKLGQQSDRQQAPQRYRQQASAQNEQQQHPNNSEHQQRSSGNGHSSFSAQDQRQQPKGQRQQPPAMGGGRKSEPLKRQQNPMPVKNAPGLINKGFDLLKMFNFGNFKLDSDITIIVVLILLLSSEETDELLLLALAYIML